MLLHIVLFRPKATLTGDERRTFLAAIEQAATAIPSLRRFRVGRVLDEAPQYQTASAPDLPFVAVAEFDDRAGLDAYLAHPAHDELGRAFNQGLEAAFVYDYDVADAQNLQHLV